MKTLLTLTSQAARYGALGLLCTLAACSDTEPLEGVVDNSGTGKLELASGVFSQRNGTFLDPTAAEFHVNTVGEYDFYGVPSVIPVTNSAGYLSKFQTRNSSNQNGVVYEDDSYITYEYLTTLDKVKMTIDDGPDIGKTEFVFNIGTNGFAKNAQETYVNDSETAPWKFDYNAAGQLLRANCYGDILTCYYDEDGNLVRMTIDDGERVDEATFTYSGVPNTYRYSIFADPNCPFSNLVPWFHPCLAYAYVAGLLGNTTPELPSKMHVEFGDRDYGTEDYYILFTHSSYGNTEVKYEEYFSGDTEPDEEVPGSTDMVLSDPDESADAAKFTVTGGSTGITSIELTEAGNYIVTGDNPAGASLMAQQKGVKNFRNPKVRMLHNVISRALSPSTRSYQLYSGIAYGTYTKIDEYTYELDGFGTIHLTPAADGITHSMELTRTNGVTETLRADKQISYNTSRMTNNLCRTWGFSQVRSYAKLNDQYIFNFSDTSLRGMAEQMKEWAQANDDEYDKDAEEAYNEMIELYSMIEPTQVIFSRLGTYMVQYASGQLAIAQWDWTYEEGGEFSYNWSGIDTPNDLLSGNVKATFDPRTLYITEQQEQSEDGMTMIIGSTFTFTEF